MHTALQREIMGIKFGTDGWRAVLGKDFTDEIKRNVYWMWSDDFNRVVFSREHIEILLVE